MFTALSCKDKVMRKLSFNKDSIPFLKNVKPGYFDFLDLY